MALSLVFLLAMGGQAAPPPPPPSPPAVVQTVAPKAPQAPRKLYNETADAKAQIAAAVASAAEDDVRVLINWGANDDDWSTKVSAAQRTPEVSAKFRDDYKLVYVDTGKLDKNLELAKSFGVTLKGDALPHLTVLDARGKVLAQMPGRKLAGDADASAVDPKKFAAFLTTNQAPPPPDALPVFNAALAQAKREDREVFLWFAAPW
jgi:hypothetical protein